jgi:hypothetical protein
MLAAALLASLWAQAEQAPAPPPAPPRPVPVAEPAAPPPNEISVHARLAYRVGNDAQAVGPNAGFSLGGMFERRYFASRRGIELGAAVDFFYDRFSTSVVGSAMDATGQETQYAADRTLSRTSFALLQTVGWRTPDLRIFTAVGAGITIGYFSSPELVLRPGNTTAAQPLARAALGAEIALSPLTAVILRADYSHAFTRPLFTTEAGPAYSLFGDVFDAGAGMLVRF